MVREILVASHVKDCCSHGNMSCPDLAFNQRVEFPLSWGSCSRHGTILREKNLLASGQCLSLAAAVAARSFVPDEAGTPGMLWSSSAGQR